MPRAPLEQTFTRRLDKAKNRFKLPFDWMSILADVEFLFATILDGKLVFFLPEAWEEVSQALLTSMEPDNIRAYNLATEVRIQKNGKISIPKKLAKLLSLGESIKLEGQGDRFTVHPADEPIQVGFDLFAPMKKGSLEVYQIPIESVEFDEARIKEAGIDAEYEPDEEFPPILVVRTDLGKYRLVWGLRQLLAQRKLGRKFVSAIILPRERAERAGGPLWFALEQVSRIPDHQMVRLVDAMRNQGLKPSAIARMLDRSVRTIQRYLVVARAPKQITDALARGEISLSLAYEAAKKGISPQDLRGKTFKMVKELIHERGLAKAPCNLKSAPVKCEVHSNGDVNLIVSFKAGVHEPQRIIEVLQRVVEHLESIKGVGHGAERGEKGEQ